MKKSARIKGMLESLDKKIEALTAKWAEKLDEDALKEWNAAIAQNDELEKQYQEALQEEALEEGKKEEFSEEELAFLRSHKKNALDEETKKFLDQMKEAAMGGARFDGTLPMGVAKMVQEKKTQTAVIRNLCTTHNEGVSEYTFYADGDEVTVGYVNPGSGASQSNPTAEAYKLAALKIMGESKINNELIKDAAFDFLGYIVSKFGKALAVMEDREIIRGAGTPSSKNAIRGITTASNCANKKAVKAGDITWDDITDTIDKVAAYKPNLTAIISPTLETVLHKMKDGDGKYIFRPNEEITRIHGCNVKVSNAFEAKNSNKPCMVVGDFSYYHILETKALEAKVLTERYADTDQTGVQVIERIDGDFVPDAFAYLTYGTIA